jgi:hypothetical protein
MMLARISPEQQGRERRTFECPKCNRTETILVAADPLKSDAVGWLNGELKPPA